VPQLGLTGADPAPWCRTVWRLTHPPPPEVIEMTVVCPVDIHLYDSLGRHVGKNYETGEVEIQIPSATYSILPEGQSIHVNTPAIGDYQMKLVARGEGNFTFFATIAINDKWTGILDFGQTVQGADYVYDVKIAEEITIRPNPIAELYDLKGLINSMPSNVFDNPKLADQRKNTLSSKIDEVILKVQAANCIDAINKLLNDIRKKVDGNPTPPDWIVKPEIQYKLRLIIDHIVSSIQTLQEISAST